jgi:hypothetical protein
VDQNRGVEPSRLLRIHSMPVPGRLVVFALFALAPATYPIYAAEHRHSSSGHAMIGFKRLGHLEFP